MNLFVDIGNSFIKTICYENFKFKNKQKFQNLDSFLKADFSSISNIYISNVNKNFELNISKKILDKKITHLKVSAKNKPINCCYKNIHTFGIDRWLCMLGSYKLGSTNCVIIDIGTAITVDFIKKNNHLGGLIAPSFKTLESSLFKSTANLKTFSIPDKISSNKLGNSTFSALEKSSFYMMQGFFNEIFDLKKEYFKEQKCDVYLTGGGSKNYLNLMQGKYIYKPNLIFLGFLFYL